MMRSTRPATAGTPRYIFATQQQEIRTQTAQCFNAALLCCPSTTLCPPFTLSDTRAQPHL